MSGTPLRPAYKLSTYLVDNQNLSESICKNSFGVTLGLSQGRPNEICWVLDNNWSTENEKISNGGMMT
jgi:hypothetical protein